MTLNSLLQEDRQAGAGARGLQNGLQGIRSRGGWVDKTQHSLQATSAKPRTPACCSLEGREWAGARRGCTATETSAVRVEGRALESRLKPGLQERSRGEKGSSPRESGQGAALNRRL